MASTTTKAGSKAQSMSTSGVRKGNDGQKNIQSMARRKSAGSQVPADRVGQSIKGPDKGMG